MNESDFEVTGAWRAAADGQEYEAVARTKKSKRIIARATGHASLDTADALDKMLGPGGRAEVEKAVKNTCKQLALKFPG
ncbi:MAG TPA: hypothetical protein VEK07_02680 [Polyangiaceae bacterium]|nr:hypothetical protein [Polyangiaceae bacterium]